MQNLFLSKGFRNHSKFAGFELRPLDGNSLCSLGMLTSSGNNQTISSLKGHAVVKSSISKSIHEIDRLQVEAVKRHLRQALKLSSR